MLQAMLDCQAELCALMLVPPGLKGVQEASIGVVKEAAELVEEVHPGSRAWRRVDYEAADKEAIDVLLYLLEYFVLRGWDADDVLNAYYAKAEIVNERQVSKVAADKVPAVESLGDLSREIHKGNQVIFAVPTDGVEMPITGEQSVDLLDAFCDSGFDEEEYHQRTMDEAIGPDSPGYVAGGGN